VQLSAGAPNPLSLRKLEQAADGPADGSRRNILASGSCRARTAPTRAAATPPDGVERAAMDPISVIQSAYELAKAIRQKLEQAKRNRSTVAALADDVADAQARLVEVQHMAGQNSKVLPAIFSAVRGLHGLLVEIRVLADSISAASLAKRWWQSGDDEQEINDLRGKLQHQLQLLMGAASLKVGVHNANQLAELRHDQQRAAQQQQFGFGGLHQRLDGMERQWQQRQKEEDERIATFMAQVLDAIAASAGGVAAQQAPTLTLADLPEAGLSKLQEAARSRLQGSGAAEAQVGAGVAVRCTGKVLKSRCRCP
jgi:hypothetical protein